MMRLIVGLTLIVAGSSAGCGGGGNRAGGTLVADASHDAHRQPDVAQAESGDGARGDPGREGAETKEVAFSNGGLTLRGTLHLPGNAEPVPGLVLIHGSGPNSRDQPLQGQLNMQFGFELELFAELAEELSAAGLAVLRYDKRSCGPFNGCADNGYPPPAADVTGHDFIADAEAALDFLKVQPGVDPSRLLLLGHSQGATFLPAILSRRSDLVAGLMVAGNHRPMDALMAYQLEFSRQLATEAGASPAEIERSLAGLARAVDQLAALRAGSHDGSPIAGVPVVFWQSMFEIGDEAPTLVAGLQRPLLALGGDYDWNVPPSEIEAWGETFRAAAEAGHQATVLSCVTHALNCITQPDYRLISPADMGRELHPPVVETMLGFLRQQGVL